MKIEYKFRAWDGNRMWMPEWSEESEFYILPDGGIKHQEESGMYERHISNSYRKGWIIMQYVGHYNNTDVYEGDRTWDGVIEYNPDTCCYVIRRDNGTFIRLDVRKDKIEIKSNIYEMPF